MHIRVWFVCVLCALEWFYLIWMFSREWYSIVNSINCETVKMKGFFFRFICFRNAFRRMVLVRNGVALTTVNRINYKITKYCLSAHQAACFHSAFRMFFWQWHVLNEQHQMPFLISVMHLCIWWENIFARISCMLHVENMWDVQHAPTHLRIYAWGKMFKILNI